MYLWYLPEALKLIAIIILARNLFTNPRNGHSRLKLLITDNWKAILLLFFVGFYFQFLIRIAQAGAFSSLKFYLIGAYFSITEAILSLCITAIFYKRYLQTNLGSNFRILLTYISGLLLFLLLAMGWQAFMEMVIWNSPFYLYRFFADTFLKTGLHSIIAFVYISFSVFSENRKIQKDLYESRNALTESELKILQHQVDPHFLFNNLNVLSTLIPVANTKAHEYITNLSELYRYILANNTKDVITLEEELRFTEKYIYLIRERFGTAYNITLHVDCDNPHCQMIPPFVMQELLINAIKHNEAGSISPLEISIVVTQSEVEVKNVYKRKRNARPAGTQTGLANIMSRFKLLTDTKVQVEQTAYYFSVVLPLLKIVKV